MKRSRATSRTQRVLTMALLALASAFGTPPLPAEEKAPAGEGKKAGREGGSLLRLQAEVERRYLHLRSLMSKILAAVEKAESTDRVSAALEESEELGIVRRLREIQDFLEKKQLRDALEEERIAEKDLLRILRILQGLDEEELARQEEEEARKLEDELERLEKLVKDQEEQVEETKALEGDEPEGSEAGEKQGKLARKQREIAEKADELRRSLERKLTEEEAAQSEESPEGRGGQEGKEGAEAGGEDQGGSQGAGGKAGGKDAGKEGGQKGGSKSNAGGGKEGGAEGSREGQKGAQGGKGQKSVSQRSSRGSASRARSLRQATQSMQGASQRLEAGNLKGAIEDEEEALAQLKRARERAEEELEEKAEEAQAQKARRLVARLRAMLADQELVSADTKVLDFSKKEAEGSAGGGSSAESLEAEGRSLARRERLLQAEAEDIRKTLNENDVSVVAPPILEEVAGNLDHAAALLDGGEAGERTQIVQRDIETALRELIEALKPPEMKPSKKDRGAMAEMMKMKAGKKAERITAVMELKMLLSAQRRLRLRTERLERARAEAPPVPEPPEAAAVEAKEAVEKPVAELDAPPPDPIAVEARRLSEAQEAVAGLAVKLMEKYPLIDPLILGGQNIEEGEKPQVVPPRPPGEDSSPRIEPGRTDPPPLDGGRGGETDEEGKDGPETVEKTEEAR